MGSNFIGRGLSASGVDGYQGETAATRPATSINLAHNALEEARQLAFRVNDLVDRLCGSVPEPASDPKGLNGPISILDSLRETSERTVDAVRTAQSRLNRLDQELS